MAPTASTGISGGPPELWRLRHLRRLWRLQKFLGDPGTMAPKASKASMAPTASTGISGGPPDPEL